MPADFDDWTKPRSYDQVDRCLLLALIVLMFLLYFTLCIFSVICIWGVARLLGIKASHIEGKKI